MIPTSRRAMALCVISAIAIEASVVFAFTAEPGRMDLQGSGGGLDIRLGNSFADFVVGSIPSAATTTLARSAVASPALAAPPMPSSSLTVASAMKPAPAALAELAPAESSAPENAPRPTERPARENTSSATQTRLASAAGNSGQPATRGQSTGRAEGQDAAQGAGQEQTAAGNAAVSNYPGQVMRHLSRISRPRVGSRGSALVAFALGTDGGIVKVTIVASSGSEELDRAALQLIDRAAPFPVPPSGATREFTVQIQGR